MIPKQEIERAREILGDLRVSVINHGFGLDEVEVKRMEDRLQAIDTALRVIEEYKKMREALEKICDECTHPSERPSIEGVYLLARIALGEGI